MKKKFFLSCVIVLFLFLVGTIFAFYCHNQNKVDELPIEEEIKLDVKEQIILDYGSDVPKFEDFCEYKDLNEVSIEIYFDDKKYDEDTLNELGEYEVKIIVGEEKYESKIIVEDKDAPELKLKEITIKENEKYDVNSFVEKCEDNTHTDCILSFEKEEMSTYKKSGTYDIVIIARDESLNEVREQTKLIIKEIEKTNNSNKNTNNSSNSGQTNISEVVTYKYGVKIMTTGSKVTYDRSTFNATTNDLKAEAAQQKTKESKFINQILTETNKYRTEKGLKSLTLDDSLTLAANIRALEMAWGDEVSHTRPDGRSCFTVLDDIGFMSFYSGENIAYMQKSGTSAATWWRNSPGHYANMINEGYSKIGIGVYKFNGQYYYVQLFSN